MDHWFFGIDEWQGHILAVATRYHFVLSRLVRQTTYGFVMRHTIILRILFLRVCFDLTLTWNFLPFVFTPFISRHIQYDMMGWHRRIHRWTNELAMLRAKVYRLYKSKNRNAMTHNLMKVYFARTRFTQMLHVLFFFSSLLAGRRSSQNGYNKKFVQYLTYINS